MSAIEAQAGWRTGEQQRDEHVCSVQRSEREVCWRGSAGVSVAWSVSVVWQAKKRDRGVGRCGWVEQATLRSSADDESAQQPHAAAELRQATGGTARVPEPRR